MFEAASTAGLIEVITASARSSAAADARKYAAIAELQRRRIEAGADLEHDAADAWDGLAAEIGAALNIGHGRALGETDIAVMLRDRFPRLGELFLRGLLTGRRVWIIEKRTDLVVDPAALAELDRVLAERILGWGPLSEWKLEQLLDAEIARIDPAAVHRVTERVRDRDFVIGQDTGTGTVPFWGRMSGPDAAIAEKTIRRMARSVCPDDPRTLKQRRGDAHAARMAGARVLTCRCGNPDCPAAAVEDAAAAGVMVHVLTDQATLDHARTTHTADGDGDGEGLHGPRTVEGELAELVEEIEADARHEANTRVEDTPPDAERRGAGGRVPPTPEDLAQAWPPPAEPAAGEPPLPDPDADPDEDRDEDRADPRAVTPGTDRRPVAIIPGHGVVPPALLADLIARGATVRPIRLPDTDPDPGYRPSAATDRFVRSRDLTCRAPGCDRPAEYADIDHTVPYPAGATHPGGLKCYCRKHHLIKTFHRGWTDHQLPDGTLVITTPTGHTYTTKPGITLLFPHWNTTTPAPPPGTAPPPGEHHALKAPRRKRTRAQTKANRINAERQRNAETVDDEPPPF